VRDECYYTDSELVGGFAPTGSAVVWQAKEPSYFFKLSEWEQPLLDFYESHPTFIAPESRKNEVGGSRRKQAKEQERKRIKRTHNPTRGSCQFECR